MKSRALPIRFIIIPLAMIYAVTLLIPASGQYREALSTAAELRAEKAELESEISELRYYIENADDDSVLAGIAEKELGLNNSDSVVFYDMSRYGG